MRVHDAGALRLPGSIVALGAFDGVHIGHQNVIGGAVSASRRLDVPTVVYTFNPPPKALFHSARILTDIGEKLRRLSALGPDYAVVASFDNDFASRPAEEFLREIASLNPAELWVGRDFRFGAQRRGDVELLARQFTVRLADTVRCSQGEVISSTRIRNLIANGDETGARQLLGWDSIASQRNAKVGVAVRNRVVHADLAAA